MRLEIHQTAELANAAAADRLARWLRSAEAEGTGGTPAPRATCNLMVAGGNSPLDLYRRIAERRLALSHVNVFVLDEYVGVPPDEPRNCANLLRRCVAEAWGIPAAQFFAISSREADALASVQAHERRIADMGGLDVVVLGLGQNGHLGFNEPGSAPDSVGRVVDLEPVSIEANRQWFAGDYAPSRGVTVGLKTLLAARHVIVLAYGSHKTAPVKAMVEGPQSERCPASFLQRHADTWLFLDRAAAAGLRKDG